MKIGVIADTHISDSAQKLPRQVYDCFKDCDLIIHAGDAVEISVIQELGKLAETKAVWGNMDSLELKRCLPEKLVLNVGGKTIGVIHGEGPAFKVHDIVRAAFSAQVDIIIFGHSHVPFNEKKGRTLLFNPGSATDKVFSQYRSFGVIEIKGDEVRAEIIKIDD